MSCAQNLPDDQREEDKHLYRQIIHTMLHVGTGLLRTLEMRAVNATMDGTNAVLEAAAAYERIARAMRRNIMLAEKLAEPTPEPATPQPTPDQPEIAPATPNGPPRDIPSSPALPRERLDRDQPERLEPLESPNDQPGPPHHDHETPFDRPEDVLQIDRPEDDVLRDDHPEDDALNDDAPTTHPIPHQLATLHRDLQTTPRKPKG